MRLAVLGCCVIAAALPLNGCAVWQPSQTPQQKKTEPKQVEKSQPDPAQGEEQEEIDELEGLDDLPGMEGGDPETQEGLVDDDDSARFRVTEQKGFLESRYRHYVREPSSPGRRDASWIHELQLELTFALGEHLGGYFRPRFLIDSIDHDLVRTKPLELYLTYERERFDVRAGIFVENWGIADTFNPVDVLNRRDLASDPLDPERLGEIGARVRWLLEGDDVLGEPTLSLYVLPFFQEAVFPTRRNRWSFAPPPGEILEDQSSGPDGAENLFAAVRGQATLDTSLFNADVQFVTARGPDRFPVFGVRPVQGGAGVQLTPEYFGSWTIGGGLRAVPNAEALADYTLKAEVVYRIPYRTDVLPAELPDEYLQYAFGFDRVVPKIFSDVDQVTLTAEWVGETGANDSTAGFRPFDDDLVLRAFWEANDFARSSVELRTLADFRKEEWIVEGIYERQLRAIDEDLRLEFGVQWIDASPESFFGLFPNNTNVRIALRLDF